MEAAGLMTDAGRRAISVAQENGYWTLLDSVEDLVEPPDLSNALDGDPDARRHWDAWPPSTRKQVLWSIVSAGKPETRAKRVAAALAKAARNERP